jgi:hypothetical protein
MTSAPLPPYAALLDYVADYRGGLEIRDWGIQAFEEFAGPLEQLILDHDDGTLPVFRQELDTLLTYFPDCSAGSPEEGEKAIDTVHEMIAALDGMVARYPLLVAEHQSAEMRKVAQTLGQAMAPPEGAAPAPPARRPGLRRG